eukprot:6198765-Pleurochrysis_carterae.AAC.1
MQHMNNDAEDMDFPDQFAFLVSYHIIYCCPNKASRCARCAAPRTTALHRTALRGADAQVGHYRNAKLKAEEETVPM